jgi:serine/threonine protein kinase
MNGTFSHFLPTGNRVLEYRIEKLLGEGGFGLTYLAFDENLHKRVAVKEYLPTDFAHRTGELTVLPRSESTREAFQWGLNAFVTEARTLARFQHPHIVQVYRYFEANGTAYIVMEYVEGRTLSQTVKELGKLTQSEVLSIMLPILDGLAEVHAAGILHRDIKPGNIRIRDNGKPVLIDFGAARQALGAQSRSITTIITPGYAPIEQYSSKGNVGPWSDIYALAAVAYYCLTRERPEDASDRVVDDHLTPAVELAKDQASESFLRSIDAALNVAPQKRPQTLTEWVTALKADRTTPASVSPSTSPSASSSASPAAAAVPAKPPAPQSPPPARAAPAAGGTKVIAPAANVPNANEHRTPIGVESNANRKPLVWILASVVVALIVTAGILIRFNPTQPPHGNIDTTGNPTTEPQPSPAPHDTDSTPASTTDRTDTDPGAPQATPLPTSQPTSRPTSQPTPAQTEPVPAPVALYITVEPPQAQIRFEDNATAYRSGMTLAPGQYQLRISLDGYRSESLRVNLVDQEVRRHVTLVPEISPQEQAAYEKAARTRTIADLEAYLQQYPQGRYAEQITTWLTQARERQQTEARAQEQARQQAQAQCEPLPGKSVGLTGRAFFDTGSVSDFKIKIGRFTVQPNAIRKVSSREPYARLCKTAQCYEVRGNFGWQDFRFLENDQEKHQGRVCFYYMDEAPHVIRID